MEKDKARSTGWGRPIAGLGGGVRLLQLRDGIAEPVVSWHVH